MAGAAKRARKTAGTRVRKNMDIDVDKLARARKALGTATDTETVDEALDLVSFRHEVADALDRLAAAGGLADPYGAEEDDAAAAGRSARGGRRRAAASMRRDTPKPDGASRPGGAATGRPR